MSKEEHPSNDRLPEFSPLKLAALTLHETYEELKRAGFTRKEALYLVSNLMIAGMTTGPE